MKLLYTSTLYPPATGGAQIHLHKLAKAMSARGNDVSVITHSCRHRTDWLRLSTICTEPDVHVEYEGIPVWQLGLSASARLRILPWALTYYALIPPAVRHISREILGALSHVRAPDVVHATRIGREFLTRAALDFARKHDVPFILNPVHHPRWSGWRYVEYDRIYRECDALFVLTEIEKKILVEEKKVDEKRVHLTRVGPVLSETYDGEEFRAAYGIPGPFVLYVGQQFRYKGPGAILEATQAVWKKHPDVTFVFIGPPTKYSKLLFSSVSDKRIRNLGEVDLRTKTSALAACEFLCLPSSQESFGGVYLEAWALGKAVIGGRIPAIAELIKEGGDGLLSSQDAGELAAAMCALLGDPESCKRMGSAGALKVNANFTWERIAAHTQAIYEQLTGSTRTAQRYESLEQKESRSGERLRLRAEQEIS